MKFELKTDQKSVSLNFGFAVVTHITPITGQPEKVKVTVKQEVERLISVNNFKLSGKTEKSSRPTYTDVRTKVKQMTLAELKEEKIRVNAVLKNIIIKRTCADEPFWNEQKKASSGFYISTKIVSGSSFKADSLKLEGVDYPVFATERDCYMQTDDVIKNVRVKVKSMIVA